MSDIVKNIPMSEALSLSALVDVEPGKVISRTFVQRPNLSITLFAFAAGEGVSTHSAPGDAMVYILAGEAKITIDGIVKTAKTGEIIVMPANIPHAVDAEKDFKMLLTVVQ
ncbi:MAG TPA: cupin domain-containing protein [Negativicutes bacterium]|nr:cupin domain-containing protein [Negativicutes bacterium]